MEIVLIIFIIYALGLYFIGGGGPKKRRERREEELKKQMEDYWKPFEEQLKQKEEQKRQEEERRKLLEQSVKYNRLCRVLNDLKYYSTPIILRLHSLNEFRAFNKTFALGVAYSEICAKYNFLMDVKFSYKLNSVVTLPANNSEYVRKKEVEVSQSIYRAIYTPVKVIWSYTSPAGRNHYSDSAYVTVEDLQEYTHQRNIRQHDTDQLQQEQYRRERERQLITPGLRYDILQRDNFRCQLCGRTQADGIKLEVDHKKPIAKGGRTEPNNLWTLCQDCNRGKGAKYYVSE